VREVVPDYERFQEGVARATGSGAKRALELGTGTGETARRVLAAHAAALLVGIDASRRCSTVRALCCPRIASVGKPVDRNGGSSRRSIPE